MNKRIALATTLFFLLTLAGCANVPGVSEEHQGAAKGAGIGAATGAVAGAVLGDDVQGALIGGLAGALIGGAVGHFVVDKEEGGQETARKYEYQPTEGTRVRIEDTDVEPKVVNPGDKVELQSTYAVLSPDPAGRVEITESFEIRHEGKLVGSPQATVIHDAGTYDATLPLFLPEDAARGAYQVTTTVSGPGTSDTRITSFEVR
ncbi:MAG: YMGG-like glycine zipper-containing protein [Desulfuromonadales bacterium]